MHEKLRNEIAAWLLDRVAAGRSEEPGSMDNDYFQIPEEGMGEVHVEILAGGDGEFHVFMDDSFDPDFTLKTSSTEEEIRSLLDKWYDEL